MAGIIDFPDNEKDNKFVKKVVGIFGGIATFFIFALVSAAPIVLLTAAVGGVAAFLVMAPIYGVLSYLIIILIAGVIDRHRGGEPTRSQKWLEAQKEHNTDENGRKKFFWRLAETGGFVGFAIACYFLGAIITVLLLNYSVKLENLKRTAAIGSLIFSIGFCATYAGLFTWILNR